jgi:hypothetical protein
MIGPIDVLTASIYGISRFTIRSYDPVAGNLLALLDFSFRHPTASCFHLIEQVTQCRPLYLASAHTIPLYSWPRP